MYCDTDGVGVSKGDDHFVIIELWYPCMHTHIAPPQSFRFDRLDRDPNEPKNSTLCRIYTYRSVSNLLVFSHDHGDDSAGPKIANVH